MPGAKDQFMCFQIE